MQKGFNIKLDIMSYFQMNLIFLFTLRNNNFVSSNHPSFGFCMILSIISDFLKVLLNWDFEQVANLFLQ